METEKDGRCLAYHEVYSGDIQRALSQMDKYPQSALPTLTRTTMQLGKSGMKGGWGAVQVSPPGSDTTERFNIRDENDAVQMAMRDYIVSWEGLPEERSSTVGCSG